MKEPKNAAPDRRKFRDLNPSAEVRQELLGEINHRVEKFLADLPWQPAHNADLGGEAHRWVRRRPPEEGVDLNQILDLLFERVIPCALNTASGGYLAYVPGGGLYSTALAEFLAAVVNRYPTVWAGAPGAAALEAETLRWLAELLGYPKSCQGVFTTGGSLSNLLAFLAARELHLPHGIDNGVVYFSSEVHHSVTKAARITGVSPANMRSIPVDERFRMRTDHLAQAIATDRSQGRHPFFICGSAGTVNSGAVDPLEEIAEIAAQEKLWFHVDGAYGGFFGLVPELQPVLRGMERSDSLAVDPHKGLFLPYGTGVLLVRDVSHLRRAFHGSAAYMPAFQDTADRVDFCELSPELSRDWRGLRVWLPFMLHGVDAFRQALRAKRELALFAWQRLKEETDLEFPVAPELSLFAFRQRILGVDPEEEDHRNRQLLERINRPRRIMLTGTELNGRFFLRFCVLHLRTTRTRVEEGVEIILKALSKNR